MQARRAILTGLRRSFDFRSRSARANGLAFLAFAILLDSTLLTSPLRVALCALGVFGVSRTTALYFSDTASRLLLPSDQGMSPLSKVQP